MPVPEHILLVDKPKGITSFDVIRKLRRELGVRKMGHAGTLDPLASGLMIVGVGEGTKILTEFLKLPKEYVAEILVGERRSTGDMEGEVLEEAEVSGLDEEQVRDELKNMIGMLTLPVSAYSAIKKDGVPMFKRARRAERTKEDVGELPIREMEVMEAELLEIQSIVVNRDVEKTHRPTGPDKNSAIYRTNETVKEEEGREQGCRQLLVVRFYVGSGTYIRSLAEELGRRLGYPATLYNLRRTRVGEFDISQARSL